LKKLLTTIAISVTLSAGGLSDYCDAITLSIGESKDKINIYRVGLRKDFTPFATNGVLTIGGYWEASLNYWEKGSSTNFGVALSPVFALYFNIGEFHPYIEAGVGASYFTKTHIVQRDISSHWLFEDRVGTGFRYKNFDFGIRYMHYSNAGIVKPNQGIDIFIGSISYKF